ncbi:hypothetical protein RvY_18166 [Ramazzottius varieornatus]|uniref:Uncharacterized protein n=1 Tax=Ramazzottius varieornatus TaxID=947166 RepID=A0A1D1W6J3_RAMVA|nr:hypothetical protein RvY_18166 [Ramazzottius varieornatus]
MSLFAKRGLSYVPPTIDPKTFQMRHKTFNHHNILNLPLSDYEQHSQLSDSPNESDKKLKTLINDFLDVQIDQAGSPILATEDLQYELLIGVSTFDQLEKSIAEPTCSMDIAKQTSNPLRMIALPNLLQYNICKRKITKFVPEKYLKEVPDRKKSAEECVAVVRKRNYASTTFTKNIISVRFTFLDNLQLIFA